MNRTVLVLGLILAGATSVSAESWWGGNSNAGREVDARQSNQQRQIQQGVRNGSVTRSEAAELAAEQRRIAEYERRAKADGRLDPREQASLNHMQNSASRNIYQESHDREARNYNGGWWRRWW